MARKAARAMLKKLDPRAEWRRTLLKWASIRE